MAKPEVTTTVTTTAHHHMQLTGAGLRQLFADAGWGNVPKIARVYIKIPGGGDYSNMDLEIDDVPIHIEWETKETR